MRIIALLFFIMCSVGVNAQQVKLSRLERAGGAGYVPYTDVNGKQGYNLLSTLLSSYVTGSGTANYYAVWSSSGVLTDGDIYWNGSSIVYDHPSGSNVSQGTSTFGYTGSGPTMNAGTGMFSFFDDSDTGLKRASANAAAIAAGSSSNWFAIFNGTTGAFTLDPDLNGVADVSISATTTSVELLTASGLITANGGVDFNGTSTSDTESMVGMDASRVNTRLVIGDQFELGDGTVYDTLKLAAANTAHLFAYDDNVGSSQTFSLTGPGTYDTLQLATTGQLESGVEYGPPNPSADSAIIFTYAGTYLVSFDFTGELSTATTNQTLRTRWNANSGTSIAGGAMSYGFETTARQTYTQTFIYQAAANDYLQLMATTGTGGAATLTVVTPKITVTRIK